MGIRASIRLAYLCLGRCAIAVVALSLRGDGAAAPALQSPLLIDGTPQPAYPTAARIAGVEGDAQFRANVKPDGTVESVVVMRVPQPNLGFEEAVETAVRKWRFKFSSEPPSKGLFTYVGSISFHLTIPREWMYPRASRTVWTTVRDLVKELRIDAERVDDKDQLLITGWRRYRPGEFVSSDALPLPAGFRAEDIQFHIFVAPGLEPARVAIGSILRIRHLIDTRREGQVIYGLDALSQWLMTKLGERMGVRAEALSGTAAGRVAQARRLMPTGLSDPCLQRTLHLFSRSSIESGAVKVPRVISEVKPFYPKDQMDRQREGKVLFEAEITEHGTVVNARHLEPQDASANFIAASQVAASLWRFQPSVVDSCPVRVRVTFEMTFVLK